MGTHMRIALYASDEASAKAAAEAAFDRVGDIESKISSWKDDSELSRLVATDWSTSEPVTISEDLYRCLKIGYEFGERSDGALDITAGPLIALWREAREDGVLPTRQALDAAKQQVGWQRIHLGEDGRSVRLEPGTQIDFGAFGKGYAIDEAARVLFDRRMFVYLIDFGGDIALGDAPAGKTGWKIDVPGWPEPVGLRMAAVATSGKSAQFVEIDGTRYSHIIDPRYGDAVTHDHQVTVIAFDAYRADAEATLLSVVDVSHASLHLRSSSSVALIVENGEPIWKSLNFPRLPGE